MFYGTQNSTFYYFFPTFNLNFLLTSHFFPTFNLNFLLTSPPCVFTLASFPDLPTIQFLIACFAYWKRSKTGQIFVQCARLPLGRIYNQLPRQPLKYNYEEHSYMLPRWLINVCTFSRMCIHVYHVLYIKQSTFQRFCMTIVKCSYKFAFSNVVTSHPIPPPPPPDQPLYNHIRVEIVSTCLLCQLINKQ